MRAPYVRTAAAACLIMSTMIAGLVSFGFFMDPVTSDLGFERGAFSLFFSILTIVAMVTLPVYGRLIRRFGCRPIVIVAGILTALGVAAFSLCRSLVAFYLVGAFTGLFFFGCSYAVVPVIVSEWFHKGSATVMGAASAVGGVMAIVVSLLIPVIISSFGWQCGYLALAVFVLLMTEPAGIFLLRSHPSDIGLLPYGADEESSEQAQGQDAMGVTYARALRMPQFWLICLALLVFSATITVTQHLAAFFVSVGFTSIMAGVLMSVASIGIIVTSAIAGPAADKFGLSKTIVGCTALYIVSWILLPNAGTFAITCVAIILLAIGNTYTSLFAPVITRGVFGTRDYSSIWGIVSMASTLGQAVGAPLWGLVYDLTGGYQMGMYLSAVLCAIMLVVLLVSMKSVKGQQQ